MANTTSEAPNPRRRQFKRFVGRGQVSRDPASEVASAPPNMGRAIVPQIITFSGEASGFSHVYRSPDEAIRHSRDNARHMRNDPSIMECLEARQRGTALLNYHLDPEDSKDPKQKQLADDVTGIIERIPQFTEYRRNLLEALWAGRAGIQHRWGFKFIHGVRRLTVVDWTPVHGDKLVFRFDDGTGKFTGSNIGIRVGTTRTKKDAIAGDRKLEMTDWGMAYFLEEWERPLLAVHKHIIEDGAFEDPLSAGRIHGVGIRDRIYWCWFQKQETMAHLMEVIERTGMGFTIYYYPYGNDQAKQDVERMAREQSRDNVILMPRMSGDPAMDAYGIERIEPSSAGIDALKMVIHEFFGHQIKRYILGQILSSESAATGLGSGVADLHQDTFYGIIAYDAVKLEETITEELVRWIVEYNFPWARNIHLRFKIDTEANEADRKLEAAKKAWDMGAKIKASDVMDLIGFSAPTADDEVLQNPSMQQQQRLWDASHPQGGGGGGPGMGGGPGADGGGGGDFPPGSPEDSFGPLMGLLQQGGDQQPEQGPQQYAKRRYSALAEAINNAAKESARNPSDAQKEAGNYRKGKVTLHGMPVTIENAKGSRRRPEWPPLAAHYGYINRTEGRDGDHVDVFIGPRPESEIVFVVDQVTEGGRFDEHKCMLGYTSAKEAKEAYLANYTPGWTVGPITAMTIPQFKAWLESGDTFKAVAKQVSRYEKNGMPASPADMQQHRVGETKSINGKTYRLNENHRWQLAQGNDDETADVDVSGLDQPEGDHKQRLGFVKKQLSKVHPHAAGIMRALQASPDFEQGAEYATQDVHPKQAAKLYQWLQQNAGNDVGGSIVHDFGEGRIGYATPAGSIIVWPEANGTHQIAYTAKTGIVDRAIGKKEEPTQEQPQNAAGLADTMELPNPQDSGEMPGAAPAPAPQTPPAAPAAQAPSDSLSDDDRAFVAQGQQEKAQRLANLPQSPTISPQSQAALDRAGGIFSNTPQGHADRAKAAYEGAISEWESAIESGSDRKTVSNLKLKATALRAVWQERQKQAKATDKEQAKQNKPPRSPKVEAAIKDAAKKLGVADVPDKSSPLLDAAESGQGGGAVPEASPEVLAKRKQADADRLKQQKLRDWENNVGLHVREAGFEDDGTIESELSKAIDRGYISDRSHLEGVLNTAKRLHEGGNVMESPLPHVQEAIRRRANRAEQERQSFDSLVKQHAQDWDIDESTLRQVADDVWSEKQNYLNERESAKKAARLITGLDAADINRLENQGLDAGSDHPKTRNLDDIGRQLAGQFPVLGWGRGADEDGIDDRDHAEALWDLLREGNTPPPSKSSPEFWEEVNSFLASQSKGGGVKQMTPEEREELDAIPFQRSGLVIRYRKWLYAGRRSPRVSPGQTSLFANSAPSGHTGHWEERKHPRKGDGKFAAKGQGVASSPGQKMLNLSAEEIQQHKDEIAELRKELLGGEITPKEAREQLTDLLGQPLKPEAKKPDFGSTSGKQEALFDKSGLPGQKNLFADKGVPDELVQKGPEEKPEPAKPKREREYSDQEIAEREQARVADEVLQDPNKASQRDLTIARGYLDANIRHEHRKLQRGDSTPDQHKNMVEGLQREADHIDSLLKDYANGRKVLPVDDMNRAEKIADEAFASDRNIGEVAKEMGLTRQEFHQIRDDVAKHMEERKALENEPSPARKRAMERQKQVQAEDAAKAHATDSNPEGEGVTEEQAKSRKWTKNEDGTYTSPNGTIWKKAAAGGEVSPVTGEQFKGGSLMPIHGLAEKKPKPEGKGTAGGDSKPKEEGKRETRPVQQMSPEMIEAERERRENEARWTKVRDGHVGELLGMGERPHYLKSTATGGGTRRWESMVESAKLSPEQVKDLADHFERKATDAVLAKEGEGPDQAASYLENANLIIDGGKAYWRKGKLKTHPDMPRASHFVSDYLNTGGQGEKLLELHESIEKLKRGESLKPKGEAEKPEEASDPATSSNGPLPDIAKEAGIKTWRTAKKKGVDNLIRNIEPGRQAILAALAPIQARLNSRQMSERIAEHFMREALAGAAIHGSAQAGFERAVKHIENRSRTDSGETLDSFVQQQYQLAAGEIRKNHAAVLAAMRGHSPRVQTAIAEAAKKLGIAPPPDEKPESSGGEQPSQLENAGEFVSKGEQQPGVFSRDQLHSEKGVEAIYRALRESPESHEAYGLRVVTQLTDHFTPEAIEKNFGKKALKPLHFKVGDVLPKSSVWDDGTPTKKKLPGTSTVWIRYKSKEDIAQALQHIQQNAYGGTQVVVVGGDFARKGTDSGEAIIRNAKVLASFE